MRWALAGLAVVMVAVLGGWYLSTVRPAWYAPPGGDAVLAQSETLENAVATQLTLPRMEGGGEWSVSVSQEDANAWLAVRLQRWSESRGVRWPRSVSGVQVRFDDGACVVGASVEAAGAGRFVSVRVVPRVGAEGALFAGAESASVGRLAVPLGVVLGLVERMTDGPWRAVFSGERALMKQPVIDLADGRRVRLLGIRCMAGRLEVRCRTERRP